MLHMHCLSCYIINVAANTNLAFHSCLLGYVITSHLYYVFSIHKWSRIETLFFWDVKQCWMAVTNIMGQTICSNTSLTSEDGTEKFFSKLLETNYESRLHIIPKQRRSQLYQGGSPKSQTRMCSLYCHYTRLIFCFQIAKSVCTIHNFEAHSRIIGYLTDIT